MNNKFESLVQTLLHAFYRYVIREDKLIAAVAAMLIDDQKQFFRLFPEVSKLDFAFFRSFWSRIHGMLRPLEASVKYLGKYLGECDDGTWFKVADDLKRRDLSGTGVAYHIALAAFLQSEKREHIAAFLKPAIADVLADPKCEQRFIGYSEVLLSENVLDQSTDGWSFDVNTIRFMDKARPQALIALFSRLTSLLYEVTDKKRNVESGKELVEAYTKAHPEALSRLIIESAEKGFRYVGKKTPVPFIWYLAALDLLINDGIPASKEMLSLIPKLDFNGITALFGFCVGDKRRFEFLRSMGKKQFLDLARLVHIDALTISHDIDDDPYIRLFRIFTGVIAKENVTEKEWNGFLRLLDRRPDLSYEATVNWRSRKRIEDFESLILRLQALQERYHRKFDEFRKGLSAVYPSPSARRAAYLLSIYTKAQRSPFDIIEMMEKRFYIEEFNYPKTIIESLVKNITHLLKSEIGRLFVDGYKPEWVRFFNAFFGLVGNIEPGLRMKITEEVYNNLSFFNRRLADEVFADLDVKRHLTVGNESQQNVRVFVQYVRDEKEISGNKKAIGKVYDALRRGDWALALFVAETIDKEGETSTDQDLKQKLALARIWRDGIVSSLKGEYLIPVLRHPHYGYGVLLFNPVSRRLLLKIYQNPPLVIKDVGVFDEEKKPKPLSTYADSSDRTKKDILDQCFKLIKGTIMEDADVDLIPAFSFQIVDGKNTFFLKEEGYRDAYRKHHHRNTICL